VCFNSAAVAEYNFTTKQISNFSRVAHFQIFHKTRPPTAAAAQSSRSLVPVLGIGIERTEVDGKVEKGKKESA
jgi:hypothetical protein